MFARIRSQLSPTVVAVAAMLFVAVGAAAASVHTSSGVISSCLKSNGALRVLGKSAGRCRKGEKALSWAKVGTPGAQGAQGSPGPQGPAGAQGIQGVQGVEGVKGVAGPTTTAAPSGSTQRGDFNIEGFQVEGGFVGASISFALELPSEPLVVWEVPYGGTNPAPQDCKGTPQEPSAAPGYMCFYDRFSGNVLATTGTNMQVQNIEGLGSAADRFGIRMVVRAQKTGNVIVSGSWAVTAP
jgi:hypothetical protein